MMTLSRFLRVVSPSLFIVLGFACGVVGQTETATVSGLVTDRTGATVPGAEVRLQSVERGTVTTTTTNNAGIYVFPSVHPGQFQISIHKPGFKQVDLLGLIVNVQDHIEQNFHLEIGSVAESVTVEAGALLINTTDAAVSTVVDRQFAENLPMNGRSFQTLIQLTPGVVLTPVSGGDEGQFSVNGQRAASNYWMVDGVSANIGAGDATGAQGEGLGGALPGFSVQGGTNSLVSVDALQEFRIQTSTYAPEFGRTPGGQISIVTRSGENQFHGTAFDYLRNDKFDANDWFANYTGQPKPEERQNDFGGTFSGPILKDRTFFFFSYEGLRLRLPTVGLSIVPTVAARNAAVSATQPLLNAFPLPNGSEIFKACDPSTDPTCPPSGQKTTDTAHFNSSFSNASTLNATSLRIDHRLSDKLTLFARYNYSPSELLSRAGSSPGGVMSNLLHNATTIQTGTVGVTWNIHPMIVNDLRFNYSRNESNILGALDNFGGAVPPPVSAVEFPSPFILQNAKVQFNIVGTGVFFEGHQGGFLQQQYNLVDSLSVQKGSHSLKFGVDYRRLNPSFNPSTYFQSFTFLNMPSAETGRLRVTTISSARNLTFRLQNLGAFAQDTWRLSGRLTLTYGLRWDLDFVPSSSPAIPAFANFNLSNLSSLSLAPSGTPAYNTTYGNFAPRVGVAYQLSHNQGWETVFRGGFGVFYDLATTQLGNLLSTGQYPYGSASRFAGGTYGSLSSSQVAPPAISAANLSINGTEGFDPNLKLPYTLEWNIALEQGLGRQQTISASYVGSAGRRLLQGASVASPNPTFEEVQLVTNGATSDYDALQVQFQRRLSHGLQTLAAYTWSHSIDSASAGSPFANPANDFVPGIASNANRGPSSFDIRNAFSLGMTYAVPAPKINSFTMAILGGWSLQNVIQARSAPPVNPFYDLLALTFTQFGGTTEIRPDIIPGQPLYLYGSQCASTLQALGELAPGQGCPGGKGFNPNAFMSPPLTPAGCVLGVDFPCDPLRQGNAGRNSLRGFGATQWDLAIHREFPIRESLKLQFRAEMFNVLNHPNFGQPSGDINDPQFGLSTQMLGKSLGGAGFGGFSALYQVGGPRSIQLALKLFF